MQRKHLLALLLLAAFLCTIAASAALAEPRAEMHQAVNSPAILAGRVYLQARTSYAGITIRVGGQSGATSADGSFLLSNVPVGSQSVTASFPGFLSAQATLDISAGQLNTLPDVTLLGGDLVESGKIDIFDLVSLGSVYGQCLAESITPDINGDGCVNVFDLVIVGANFGESGPIPWGSPLATPTTPAYPGP